MYNLELEQVKKEILKSKAKTVLVQLPDGLKPRAKEIVDELRKGNSEILIWLGSCFGACDVPKADVDLVVQFGHNEYGF